MSRDSKWGGGVTPLIYGSTIGIVKLKSSISCPNKSWVWTSSLESMCSSNGERIPSFTSRVGVGLGGTWRLKSFLVGKERLLRFD